MLNILWPIFIIISIIYSIISGNLENLNKSIFESTESVVNFSLTLLGMTYKDKLVCAKCSKQIAELDKKEEE